MHSQHQDNFTYRVARYKARVYECPMLTHLPLETRRKYVSKLDKYCRTCLVVTYKCICHNGKALLLQGRCNSCTKSLYTCGHEEAEKRIEMKRCTYNKLYQEVQRHYLPKDLVAPKLSQKTSTIYALFSKINTLLPHQWQQNTPMATIIPQDNEDLNLLCEVSGLNRKDIKKPS